MQLYRWDEPILNLKVKKKIRDREGKRGEKNHLVTNFKIIIIIFLNINLT